MKSLYLESVGGIAGDMFTASFLDAAVVDLREMSSVLETIGLPDTSIRSESTRRRGLPCTYLEVTCHSEKWKNLFHFRPDGTVRMYELRSFVGGLSLESSTIRLAEKILLIHAGARLRGGPVVGEGALPVQLASASGAYSSGESNDSRPATTMQKSDPTNPAGSIDPAGSDDPKSNAPSNLVPSPNIAEALFSADPLEGKDEAMEALYAAPGVVDLLVDIIFAAHCIRRSEATSFYASPVRSGGGYVGQERNPIFPTSELYRGLPVQNLRPDLGDALRELSTPTGLAILRALEPEFLPSWPDGKVRSMGLGAGQYESDEFANVFRMVLMDRSENTALYSEARREPEGYVRIKYRVQCGLGAESQEKLAKLMDSLEHQSASDVRLYQRKNSEGKPGLGLTFLCDGDDLTTLSDYLLNHSTAFAIRYEKLRPGASGPASGSAATPPSASRTAEEGSGSGQTENPYN